MMKFLDKNILFIARLFLASLLGMTFLVAFTRLTRNYEMFLVYNALGIICIGWVGYKCFGRGVGK